MKQIPFPFDPLWMRIIGGLIPIIVLGVTIWILTAQKAVNIKHCAEYTIVDAEHVVTACGDTLKLNPRKNWQPNLNSYDSQNR